MTVAPGEAVVGYRRRRSGDDESNDRKQSDSLHVTPSYLIPVVAMPAVK